MTSQGADHFFSRPDARAAFEGLDSARVPTHVAIIMDGNGRWAAERGLSRAAGHKAGAQAVQEAILSCLELGVRYLTLYSFSSENWRRSSKEVSALMTLFVQVLEREIDHLMQKDVRVRVIGREEGVPPKTMRAFRDAEEKTRGNGSLDLVIALNYGARSEIVDAARTVARRVSDGLLEVDSIGEEEIADALYTAGLPDPDLLVRTSGELRLSNFLLWQVAYSELWVTDALWPDFDRNDMLEAIVEYQGRERRFGGRNE
jgi:undecaprenyl diphosphate synthase